MTDSAGVPGDRPPQQDDALQALEEVAHRLREPCTLDDARAAFSLAARRINEIKISRVRAARGASTAGASEEPIASWVDAEHFTAEELTRWRDRAMRAEAALSSALSGGGTAREPSEQAEAAARDVLIEHGYGAMEVQQLREALRAAYSVDCGALSPPGGTPAQEEKAR